MLIMNICRHTATSGHTQHSAPGTSDKLCNWIQHLCTRLSRGQDNGERLAATLTGHSLMWSNFLITLGAGKLLAACLRQYEWCSVLTCALHSGCGRGGILDACRCEDGRLHFSPQPQGHPRLVGRARQCCTAVRHLHTVLLSLACTYWFQHGCGVAQGAGHFFPPCSASAWLRSWLPACATAGQASRM